MRAGLRVVKRKSQEYGFCECPRASFNISIVHVIVYEAKDTAVVVMPVSHWLTSCHLYIPLRGVSQNLHSHALFCDVLASLMGMHVVCGVYELLQ